VAEILCHGREWKPVFMRGFAWQEIVSAMVETAMAERPVSAMADLTL
jgi:hypothetical protein